MIGNGLEKDLIEKKYNINLPKNIIALGSLIRKDALSAVAASKMLICTSKSEGLPTAVMEAMILQKTIVAPNSYGCAEVLDYGKYGYLYTPFDLNSLILKFKMALADKEIGKSAKIFAEKNYNWERIAKEIDEQYERLLK
jgi:glycosyltransferase involved in cell wall biosynthesis